jgi:hypothetical protein
MESKEEQTLGVLLGKERMLEARLSVSKPHYVSSGKMGLSESMKREIESSEYLRRELKERWCVYELMQHLWICDREFAEDLEKEYSTLQEAVEVLKMEDANSYFAKELSEKSNFTTEKLWTISRAYDNRLTLIMKRLGFLELVLSHLSTEERLLSYYKIEFLRLTLLVDQDMKDFLKQLPGIPPAVGEFGYHRSMLQSQMREFDKFINNVGVKFKLERTTKKGTGSAAMSAPVNQQDDSNLYCVIINSPAPSEMKPPSTKKQPPTSTPSQVKPPPRMKGPPPPARISIPPPEPSNAKRMSPTPSGADQSPHWHPDKKASSYGIAVSIGDEDNKRHRVDEGPVQVFGRLTIDRSQGGSDNPNPDVVQPSTTGYIPEGNQDTSAAATINQDTDDEPMEM